MCRPLCPNPTLLGGALFPEARPWTLPSASKFTSWLSKHLLNGPVGPHPETASEENLGHQAWQGSLVKTHSSSCRRSSVTCVSHPESAHLAVGTCRTVHARDLPEPAPDPLKFLTMVMTTTSEVWEESNFSHPSPCSCGEGCTPCCPGEATKACDQLVTWSQCCLQPWLGKNQALTSSQLCGGCPEGQRGKGADSKGPAWPVLECWTQPSAT